MTPDQLEAAISQWLAQGTTDVFLHEGQTTRVHLNGEVVPVEDTTQSREDHAALWHACEADPSKTNERDARYQMTNGSYLPVNLSRAMGRLHPGRLPRQGHFPRNLRDF